jgi:hypothetical protein
MARRKTAVTGLISEMKAQIELAKDPNILVFTPLAIKVPFMFLL